MKQNLLAATFTILTCSRLFATCIADADPIFSTESGRAHFREVLRAGRFGFFQSERAAFIVARGDGGFDSVAWPPTQSVLKETFQGVIPPATQAIIHTHPLGFPLPSDQDREEAVRLGIPIYVLTPHNIYKTERSRIYIVVRNQDWFHNTFDSQPQVRRC